MRQSAIDRRVSSSRRETPIDYERIAEFLSALAYPVRLELLDKLRFPHTVGEIEVTPHRKRKGGNPDRPLARQTVQGHIDKLMAAGFVRSDEVEQSGREVPAYRVEASRLYALIEELRRLSTLYAGRGPGADATGTLSTHVEPERVEGPRLVLVRGVYEGKAFPLDDSTKADGRWVIGRERSLPIGLDYDPFVSQRNSVLTLEDGRFTITDLPESKNGTAVNWSHLPAGGSKELHTGDVIGVGRSLLSFIHE